MKSIVFVPAHGGTGQTTILKEVAKAMARKGKRVLLVGNGCSYPNIPTFDNYLYGRCPLDEVLTEMDAQLTYSYWYSTSLRSVSNLAKTLDEAKTMQNECITRLTSVNREFAKRFDVVIYDLRCCLSSLEDIVIGQCDCCLLTAAANRFRGDFFAHYVDELLRIKSENVTKIQLGVVFAEVEDEDENNSSFRAFWDRYNNFALFHVRHARTSCGVVIPSKKINSNFFEDVENLAAKLLK